MAARRRPSSPQHHFLSLGGNHRCARLRRPNPIQGGQSAGNTYGASFTSNNGALKPDETALASARFQGKRAAELAAQFIRGRNNTRETNLPPANLVPTR
jgi:hypothetical protein